MRQLKRCSKLFHETISMLTSSGTPERRIAGALPRINGETILTRSIRASSIIMNRCWYYLRRSIASHLPAISKPVPVGNLSVQGLRSEHQQRAAGEVSQTKRTPMLVDMVARRLVQDGRAWINVEMGVMTTKRKRKLATREQTPPFITADLDELVAGSARSNEDETPPDRDRSNGRR